MDKQTIDLALDATIKDPHGEEGETTVRAYLAELLTTLIIEAHGFSGKRPLGNSGWELDIPMALITAGVLKGSAEYDEDGYLDDYSFSSKEADDFMSELIRRVFGVAE